MAAGAEEDSSDEQRGPSTPAEAEAVTAEGSLPAVGDDDVADFDEGDAEKLWISFVQL